MRLRADYYGVQVDHVIFFDDLKQDLKTRRPIHYSVSLFSSDLSLSGVFNDSHV